MSLPLVLVWLTTGAVLTLVVLALLGTLWSTPWPLPTPTDARHPGGTPEGHLAALREDLASATRDLATLAQEVQEVAQVVRILTPAPDPARDPRCTCHQVLGHSRSCAEQWPHTPPPGPVVDPGAPWHA